LRPSALTASPMGGEPFVGRGPELRQLRDLLAGLSAGTGGAVLVEGEQGIGKSALLRAGLAAATDAGCKVLWGTADKLGQRLPLSLMADSLGPAVRPGGLLYDGGGVLAGDPVLAGIERVLALVDRLCAQSPVVLVAEDLQWADEASLLAWHRLSRAVCQLPLLLAGSWRREPGNENLTRLRGALASRGETIIDLGDLSDAEVGELVGQLVGAPPGRRLSELVSRAGGNPLYARELTDALAREGRMAIRAGEAELTGSAPVRLPATLAAAIHERLGGLASDVVMVLRWAAVLGHEFSVSDLQLVTGRTAGGLMEVVDAATGAGVLVDAGRRLAFRHGLIRQALCEEMPESLRDALHLQAARALAASGAAPERVAGQLMAAGEGAGGWLPDWLAAAAPALVYRAPQVTADLVTRALGQLADDDSRRQGLEATLVRAAYLLLRDEDVERAGRQLISRTADPDLAAEMAWLVISTLHRTGQADQAVSEAATALARPGVSETHTARLRALQAAALTSLGHLDLAAQTAATALAGAERAGDPLAVGYACMAMENVSYFQLAYSAGLDYIERGLAAAGDQAEVASVRLRLLANKAAVLSILDRTDEAITSSRQALELAEIAGIPGVHCRIGLAIFYFNTGAWDDALAELEQAVGPADAFGPNSVSQQLLHHGFTAMIAGCRGDRSVLDEHLAAVRNVPLEGLHLWANAFALVIARAISAEQDGEPGAAVAALAPYLYDPIAQQAPGRVLVMPMLTRLAMTAGDIPAAALAAQAVAEAAHADRLAGSAAWSDHCRGLAAGDPAPVLAAAAHFEKTGNPLARGHALEDAAVLAASSGDGQAARDAFAVAAGLYRSLDARWDIRRAAARLRPFGIRAGRVPTSAARPASGWDALTPTEIKVARLVATGRSNPDVAQELFLSRNTVQTHVSHILAKLGARSRAEIIRQALLHL
jgi:DNA-binding CsgD family transcriptional regulator/tetratricopeptide (TPR) repeat protein